VRRRILQLVSLLVLLVCFGSHISELLDHWDHTLETGNDIESVLVVLALTAGVALAVAGTSIISLVKPRFLPAARPIISSYAEHHCGRINATHSPPLLALRI
jgi:hypothetical protein